MWSHEDRNFPSALNDLESDAAREHIVPFWTVLNRAHPIEPQPAVKPFVWKWEILHGLLERAGKLVDTSEGRAERRAFSLLNPGLGGKYGTTHTLIAGVQMILPGEVAYAHRHTPDALRFIIEGHGAYTTVEGEKLQACFSLTQRLKVFKSYSDKGEALEIEKSY